MYKEQQFIQFFSFSSQVRKENERILRNRPVCVKTTIKQQYMNLVPLDEYGAGLLLPARHQQHLLGKIKPENPNRE